MTTTPIPNAIEILASAHRSAQRTAMEARDTLLHAEDAVRHAKQALTQAEYTVEYLREALKYQACPAGGEHVWAEQEEAGTGRTGWACDNCHAPMPACQCKNADACPECAS